MRPWHKYIDDNVGPFSVPSALAVISPTLAFTLKEPTYALALLTCWTLNWVTFKFRDHVNEDKRFALYSISCLIQVALAMYCHFLVF